MARPRTDPLQRFMEKVYLDRDSGCWLWMGHHYQKTGYAGFHYSDLRPRGAGSRGSGNVCGHVAAWHLFNGPIPEGMVICHHCDVPGCVNPDHLFLGTYTDNMQDAAAKGRMDWQPWHRQRTRHDEEHHMAKLTEADVE